MPEKMREEQREPAHVDDEEEEERSRNPCTRGLVFLLIYVFI